MPAFAVKLAFGEMGETVLLGSQRVEPSQLIHNGYQFRFNNLQASLQNLAQGLTLAAKCHSNHSPPPALLSICNLASFGLEEEFISALRLDHGVRPTSFGETTESSIMRYKI